MADSVNAEELPMIELLRWVETRDGSAWFDRAMELGASLSPTELFRQLQRQLDLAKASFLSEQVAFGKLAVRKLRQARGWLWTKQLLEQASDEDSARLTASHFPLDRPVFDLCCGAGVDAIALAQRGRNLPQTTAIDSSEVACLLTAWNAKQSSSKLTVLRKSIENLPVDSEAFVHIDPDRRKTGGRTTTIDVFSPGKEVLTDWMKGTQGGSIKLAPATEVPEDWSERTGRQWIGVQRSVRQQRVWWGCSGFPVGTRTASVLKQAGQWTNLVVEESELAELYSHFMETDEQPTWIGDTDPVIRAADLNGQVAKLCKARLIGDHQGYLVADVPLESDFVDWFQVESLHAIDVKKLRKHLKSLGIGRLEIKKRGVETDIDKLRSELRLEGEREATLILFRNGKVRQAALAKRWSSGESKANVH